MLGILGELKVAHPRNMVSGWISQNRNIIFPFLAFAIPLLVRVIPEILMGSFLVGFDSIGYYVPNTLLWLKNGVNLSAFLTDAPLIYLLLMSLTSIGASIVISLKIIAPLLLGFLGLSVYIYAYKALSWSHKKSLLVVLLATLYFVSLRISWDLLRSELGLIFLFLALTMLQKKGRTIKTEILLSLTLVLIVFTHQLVAVIAFAIIIASALRLALDKKKTESLKLIAYSIPAALFFVIIVYITYFMNSISVIGFSGNFSMGFESLASASYSSVLINNFGFLIFCYLPLLPLLFFGCKHLKSNIQLKTWIIWCLIPVLLVLIPNFFIGDILPYRWILLLTYPLAFYAAEGFSAIKWNWYKIAVASILVILSVSFLALPNSSALGYYNSFPSYVPKSMLQNTVQLSDCQSTVNALIWAQNNIPNNGFLLVHEAFYGWATLNFNSSRMIFYGFSDPLKTAQKYGNSTNVLYLIWWVNGTGWYGESSLPQSFVKLYQSGNIAIYKYSTIR